jgi:hypothetical protein
MFNLNLKRMKMFTKLIRLMMTLALMSAIVVGQSQQFSKKSGAVAISAGDVLGPISNPIVSQAVQKGIGGTDALLNYVINGGSTSGTSRAPSNYYQYQRTQYLLTPAEMAAAGFVNGDVFNAIGFLVAMGGTGTMTPGTLSIWLKNTADVTYTLGITWNMATFTQVSTNTSWTAPIYGNAYMIDFTNPSAFTYTGGGIYVAWQFEAPGGVQPGWLVTHYCNTALNPGLAGERSTTGHVALATSAFRPATILSTLPSNVDIIDINNIYTLEKAPIPFGVPATVGLYVSNVSAAAQTFDITITGPGSYSSTQTVTGLAGNTGTYVNFADWTPTAAGDFTMTAATTAITGEIFTLNNSLVIPVKVSSNLYGYSNFGVGPGVSYGFGTGGEGIFAAKYEMNGTGLITGANLCIGTSTTNTGKSIYAVALDDVGTIIAQSAPYTILSGDLGLYKSFTFPVPAVLTNEIFYIGLAAPVAASAYNPMGMWSEMPDRGNTFYDFDLTGGTAYDEVGWRFGIEASVTAFAPYSLGVSNISAASSQLFWTSSTGLTDIELGLAGFTPTGIPTNANVTSPITVTTTPATSYSYYARDINGTILGDWVGPYTFSTFCQDCPVGATAEGEAQLPNGSTGAGINGGCAVSQPLLTSPIALGQTYCGQSNTFINDLGAASRDNDYYYLNLTSPANIYWHITATLKGNSLVNITLFDAGALDCNIGAVASVTTTSACQTATIDVDVPSGHYYVVARVSVAAGNLWPVGSGPWQYVLTVNGSQLGAPNLDPDPPATITKMIAPGGTATENLSIGNIGAYPLDYSATTSGLTQTVFVDNFDTYIAGQQLACQSTPVWTTWSNLPCNAVEDAYVSNAHAFSGANSTVIALNNDLVRLHGDLSSGKYSLSFQMFIPTGKAGYYNTLSDFTYGTGGYWAMQVYFNVGGTGYINANHVNTNFTWAQNTWQKVELIVDLDNDLAEFWVGGNFVYSWPWTQGSSTGVGPLIIDANDFFGATANDEMYIDDYKVEAILLDWLTLDGSTASGGTVNPGDPPVNIVLGFNTAGKPAGTYNKVINFVTNELGAKNSYTINVTMNVGYVLSGNVTYGFNVTTKYMATNTTVTCTPGPTVPTGPLGAYDIRPLGNGNYTLTGNSTKPYGGLQNLDAIQVQKFVAGSVTFTDLQKRAGDVNKSNSVQNLDATFIRKRVSGIIVPQWTAPDWIFDGPFGAAPALQGLPVVILNGNVTVPFKTLCSGDVNGSYNPPAE